MDRFCCGPRDCHLGRGSHLRSVFFATRVPERPTLSSPLPAPDRHPSKIERRPRWSGDRACYQSGPGGNSFDRFRKVTPSDYRRLVESKRDLAGKRKETGGVELHSIMTLEATKHSHA